MVGKQTAIVKGKVQDHNVEICMKPQAVEKFSKVKLDAMVSAYQNGLIGAESLLGSLGSFYGKEIEESKEIYEAMQEELMTVANDPLLTLVVTHNYVFD